MVEVKTDNVGATNTLAMLSLVLGLLVVVIGPFGSFPGLICGIIALFQYHKSGIKHGRGIAVSGIVVSSIGFILSSLLFILFFRAAVSNDSDFLEGFSESLQEMSEEMNSKE